MASVDFLPARLPRGIASNYWGKLWCRRLSELEMWGQRLSQGRSLLRRGGLEEFNLSVGHLLGTVVQPDGEGFEVEASVESLNFEQQQQIEHALGAMAGSWSALLMGELSQELATELMADEKGLFAEFSCWRFSCGCLDDADLCGHVAALLYGCGVYFDQFPLELLKLRGMAESQANITAEPTESRLISIDDATAMFPGVFS